MSHLLIVDGEVAESVRCDVFWPLFFVCFALLTKLPKARKRLLAGFITGVCVRISITLKPQLCNNLLSVLGEKW